MILLTYLLTYLLSPAMDFSQTLGLGLKRTRLHHWVSR